MNIKTGLLLLAGVALTTAAQARIEAPDHVFYGNVTLFGAPAAPGQRVEVRMLATGEVLASYELGFDERLGDQYALRVPMDTVDPRIEGRARPGDPVRILIGDVPAAEAVVGAEGTAVRLDLDPQNLGTGPSLNISNAEVFEGNAGTTPMTFNVTMVTTAEDDVRVFWNTVDDSAVGGAICTAGIDYLADQNELIIPAGQMQGSITVLVCGNTQVQPTRRFKVELKVQGAVPARPAAFGTIIDDDDVPGLRVADVSVLEPPAGTSLDAVFRPKLSKRSDFEARFDYTTVALNAQPGVDFVATSGSVTIPAGELETEIPVTILNSPGTSAPKSFQLRFSGAFNLVLDQPSALGVINDPRFRPAARHEQDVVNQQDVIGMANPTALALSPDGEHAYVTSQALDAVVAFRRDARSGRLTALDRYDVSTAGFGDALLDGVIDITVSPDGRHVYVAAREDDAIAVLARNAATGRLSFVENRAQATPGITGLTGVRRLIVSADGTNLYAAAAGERAVAVFRRDAVTGALEFIQAAFDGRPVAEGDELAVRGMDRPAGLALSGDGRQLYVASRFGDALQVFERLPAGDDGIPGRLRFVSAYENGLAGVIGLDGAFNIVVSGDDRHVYVTAEQENAVLRFDRNADGTLGQREVWRQSSPERPGLGGAQGLAISPDGTEVFATGLADHSLTLFERIGEADQQNRVPGALVVRQTLFDDQGEILEMAGPTAVVASGDDKHIYVVASEDNAIVVLKRVPVDMIFKDDFGDPH
ncbi:MAG: beta-propeller fold lactonase family protein [Wenzhouxiangellaceae bacterium]|nr:beta-propeller fold lactonase family protein [Wenzhouxiangellaceae bacterium]